MPVDTSQYPNDWNTIALSVKEASDWRCGCCGKQCYRPGERPKDLSRSQWTAHTLQVHHRNRDPKDNRLSNLLSLCAVCHLNLHRGGQHHTVCKGQLSLW